MDLNDLAFIVDGEVRLDFDKERPSEQWYRATLTDGTGEPCTVNIRGMEHTATASGVTKGAAENRLASKLAGGLLIYSVRTERGENKKQLMGLPPWLVMRCTCPRLPSLAERVV